jgi:transcriptional regulator with XRE-family HTH domain
LPPIFRTITLPRITTKETNPVDHHVGARVRLRRIMLGMSQEKLGDALGVTFQQVQKYEKGANRIGASRLENISRVLEVPPSYFFDGMSGSASQPGFAEEKTPSPIASFLSTAEGLHLNRAFSRIKDAKVRRRVIDLVVAMAEDETKNDVL